MTSTLFEEYSCVEYMLHDMFTKMMKYFDIWGPFYSVDNFHKLV